jgi:hypothetical protein
MPSLSLARTGSASVTPALAAGTGARSAPGRQLSPRIVTIHDWTGATLETPVEVPGRRLSLATELDRVYFYLLG